MYGFTHHWIRTRSTSSKPQCRNDVGEDHPCVIYLCPRYSHQLQPLFAIKFLLFPAGILPRRRQPSSLKSPSFDNKVQLANAGEHMAKQSSANASSPPQEQTKKRRRTPSSSASSRKKTTKSSTTTSSSSTPSTGKKANIPTVSPTNILIIDNGGDTLKYGWASTSSEASNKSPSIIPNITARLKHQWSILVGDELSQVQNPNSLYGITRSTERGVIVDLGNQTQVWKRLLDQAGVVVPQNTEASQVLGWGKVGSRAAAAKKLSASPGIPAHTVSVLLLLPPLCPRLLLDQIMFVWMEDFGVGSVGFANSSTCAAEEHPSLHCSCVVDLGWSATNIVPTYKKKPIAPEKSIRRVPIGGRHMVNMLKYYMSYRQYNLMDQEGIMKNVFESLSYLSSDFANELGLARHLPLGLRPYDREFILPDYQNTFQGHSRLPLIMQRKQALMQQQKDQEQQLSGDHGNIDGHSDEEDSSNGDGKNEDPMNKDDEGNGNDGDDGPEKDDEESDNSEDEESPEERRKRILMQREKERQRLQEMSEEEQVLSVSLERFTVPEVLFRPFDAGLLPEVVGISRAIYQAIQATPEPYRPALYQNIYVTGGLSQLKNIQNRLEEELRTLIPTDFKLNVQMSSTPIHQAWLGAHEWVRKTTHTEWSVSRDEWMACSKRKAYARLLVSNGGWFV